MGTNQQNPAIVITSLRRAPDVIEKNRFPVGYIISIGTPGGAGKPAGFETVPIRLRLEFDDIPAPLAGRIPPSRRHAQEIINFAKKIEGRGVNPAGSGYDRWRGLLIHCDAGISRSTAAALIVYNTWSGVGHEYEHIATVHRIRPQARPNDLLVKHGDVLLGAHGEMVKSNKALKQTLRHNLYRGSR